MKRLMNKSTIALMMMTLLAVTLTGCLGLGGGSGKITVATAVPNEAKTLGYMYKYLIENKTDVDVEVKTGFSATPPIISAMKNGEAQLATMYSGEIFNGHFPIDESNKDPEYVLKTAQKGFAKDPWNFKWFDSHGFKNQYAIAVREEFAKKYNIDTISDLKKVSDKTTIGVDNAWLQRDVDGYGAFKDTYFSFGDTKPMAISLVYDALKNEEVDAALIYTTDARIAKYNLKVIEDNKNFFPPYLASSVATKEMLKKYPEVEEALKLLVGEFDVKTMRRLNGKVSLHDKKPKEVAKNYLEEHNMLD